MFHYGRGHISVGKILFSIMEDAIFHYGRFYFSWWNIALFHYGRCYFALWNFLKGSTFKETATDEIVDADTMKTRRIHCVWDFTPDYGTSVCRKNGCKHHVLYHSQHPPPPRHKVEGSEIQQAALQKKRVLAQKAANDFSVNFVIGGRGVRNKEWPQTYENRFPCKHWSGFCVLPNTSVTRNSDCALATFYYYR